MAYTKKEWSYKDEISHERLNDIENGLEELSNQIDKNTDLIDSLNADNTIFRHRGRLTSADDLNNVYLPGTYQTYSGEFPANDPSSAASTFIVFGVPTGGSLTGANYNSRIQQIAMRSGGSANIYYRTWTGSAWTDWKLIVGESY